MRTQRVEMIGELIELLKGIQMWDGILTSVAGAAVLLLGILLVDYCDEKLKDKKESILPKEIEMCGKRYVEKKDHGNRVWLD